MTEKNGNGWVLRFVVSSLYAIIVLAIITIANNVIANDKDSRERDVDQSEKHNVDIKEITQRWDDKSDRILIAQSAILTELKYIRNERSN